MPKTEDWWYAGKESHRDMQEKNGGVVEGGEQSEVDESA